MFLTAADFVAATTTTAPSGGDANATDVMHFPGTGGDSTALNSTENPLQGRRGGETKWLYLRRFMKVRSMGGECTSSITCLNIVLGTILTCKMIHIYVGNSQTN